uniref:Peripheral subunit-binding (PSBD) domain-containing protein n=1 Tax=Panagrolaimus superbus TaxID=310955 RepID=A0A914XWC5_9BILA
MSLLHFNSTAVSAACRYSVQHHGLMGPAVKLMINQYNIDPAKINGTGPKKNLLKSDVLSFIDKENLKPVIMSAAEEPYDEKSDMTVTFQTRPYKLHKLDQGPASETTLTRKDALDYYRKMQVIRRMETSAGNLYKEKKVRGFCHLYTGQEACAVGMIGAMDKKDAVITAYRCHGWTYLLGSTVLEVIAELTGKISGNVYGKGGSMHMYDKNFFGGNGIVGAQQPLGAGVAFAMKYTILA